MRRVFGLFLYHPEKRVSPAKACTCTGVSNAGVLFFIDARPYRCGKCRLRFTDPRNPPRTRSLAAKRNPADPIETAPPSCLIPSLSWFAASRPRPCRFCFVPAHQSVCIMSRRGFRANHPAATLVWPGHRNARVSGPPLDLSPRARADFFLRLLLSGISDHRLDRPAGNPSG